MTVPVVAVDGPSGSGKGTLARRLADALGFHLLDSGALYRIVAAVALDRGIELDAAVELAAMAATLDIRFEGETVWVGGADYTRRIREEDVSAAASRVAALAEVRAAILEAQQVMRRPPGLVADGRDMGTVVFPDAIAKIFLDASLEARARRRENQLKNKGLDVSFRALLASLKERDERDRGRVVSPLEPAPDAHVIDSTNMSIDEVVAVAIQLVSERGLSVKTD